MAIGCVKLVFCCDETDFFALGWMLWIDPFGAIGSFAGDVERGLRMGIDHDALGFGIGKAIAVGHEIPIGTEFVEGEGFKRVPNMVNDVVNGLLFECEVWASTKTRR